MHDKLCYDWDMMPGRPATKPATVFGARLSALRQERGWTQAELAEKLGVSVKAVTYYEREVSSPNMRTLERVAQALGVDPSELLDATAEKRAARKPGPASQLEQRIAALRELPRERQKVVLQVIDTFLRDAQKAS